MDVDFWGVVNGTKAFLPHLIESGDGHVVNVSSLFGIFSVPGQAAYNAAKFAVRGFTEALRQEMVAGQAPGQGDDGAPRRHQDRDRAQRHRRRGHRRAEMAKIFDKKLARTTPGEGRQDHPRGGPQEQGPRARRPRRQGARRHRADHRVGLPEAVLDGGQGCCHAPSYVSARAGGRPATRRRPHRDRCPRRPCGSMSASEPVSSSPGDLVERQLHLAQRVRAGTAAPRSRPGSARCGRRARRRRRERPVPPSTSTPTSTWPAAAPPTALRHREFAGRPAGVQVPNDVRCPRPFGRTDRQPGAVPTSAVTSRPAHSRAVRSVTADGGLVLGAAA